MPSNSSTALHSLDGSDLGAVPSYLDALTLQDDADKDKDDEYYLDDMVAFQVGLKLYSLTFIYKLNMTG